MDDTSYDNFYPIEYFVKNVRWKKHGLNKF